jgi:hypothetical protein
MRDGEAHDVVGCAGGGWRESVGDELVRRKESLGKSSRPRPLDGILSSTEMLHEEGTTVKHLAGSEVDGEAGPVVVTASLTSGRGERSKERQACARRRKWKGLLHGVHAHGDRHQCTWGGAGRCPKGAGHGSIGAESLTSGPSPFKLFQTNFKLPNFETENRSLPSAQK